MWEVTLTDDAVRSQASEWTMATARQRTRVAYTRAKNDVRATHQFEVLFAVLATSPVTTLAKPTEFAIRRGSLPMASPRSPMPETMKNASGKRKTNSR
jgi:hypothetical protein